MKEKLLELLDNLVIFSQKNKVKWLEGTEEGEYYLYLSGNRVLISKKDTDKVQEYTIKFKNNDSPFFSLKFNSKDAELFSKVEELYDTIHSNSEASCRTIDEILKELNKQKD